jgi:ATP-dependent RNA helicase DDX24/MAK5
MRTHPLKRKLALSAAPPHSKRAKRRTATSANDLPWRVVPHVQEAGGDDGGADDGILELEEVENVRLVYEDTPAGRVIKFEVCRECVAFLMYAVLPHPSKRALLG